MNALLRQFVELIGTDLAAAGFVRRGPVFRHFDSEGNGIALDIQRTTALRGQTAAPAIALLVFDSDCAFATAADPHGGAVDFYLNEEIVRALVDDNDRFEPLNSQAATGLLTWAAKAGLVASPDRLATAIEERPGPFGDGILEFAEALGIAELPG